MAKIVHWFYRLTYRERFFCILSLIAIMFAIWLYLLDFLREEKQWYLAQINTYTQSIDHSHKIKLEKKIANINEYDKSLHIAYFLNGIQQSLLDSPDVQLLSIDAAMNNSATIKFKGGVIGSAQYLLKFNLKYPNFYWDTIDYYVVDSEGFLTLKIKLSMPQGDHL